MIQTYPWLASLLMAGCLLASTPLAAQEYERAPVRWSESEPQDDVSALLEKMEAGEVTLNTGGRELLEQLLEVFDVPVSSQMLVFSKTSLQRSRISPRTPRALYFNDRVYVGWVPGGAIELATMDPQLGVVFYLVESPPPHREPLPADDQQRPQPQFIRDKECMSCHGGLFVRGVPGLFARSVFSSRGGDPLLQHGSEIVDHRTPFGVRWGGWYVTGEHGDEPHRGNVLAGDGDGGLEIDFEAGANVTDLSPLVDLSGYPAATSDIVALMVMEHQMAMHNALTRAQLRGRHMLHYQTMLQREMGEEITGEPTFDSVIRVLDDLAQEVVDLLLFKDEAPMPDGGVQGHEKFVADYQRHARRDSTGRSLRDFNLRTRLMQNRCSPLIDSELFAAMPEPVKERVYERLAQALHPDEPDPRYRHIGQAERQRIANILRETHDGLPAEWLQTGEGS